MKVKPTLEVSPKTEKDLDYVGGYEICKAVEFTMFF
jgi:hypothetical protein